MVSKTLAALTAAFSLFALLGAQTFQRLGGCPTLVCIFPPDQCVLLNIWSNVHTLIRGTEPIFLAGQLFDIRVEVHAPVNGSEANGGKLEPNFTLTIAKVGEKPKKASKIFKVAEPALERWNLHGLKVSSSNSAVLPKN